MRANVGGVDKVLRIIVGLVILGSFFVLHGNARWFALVGVVPLATALMRFCPLYAILGISSRGRASDPRGA